MRMLLAGPARAYETSSGADLVLLGRIRRALIIG